jgi:predicted nucleotidyltransferase
LFQLIKIYIFLNKNKVFAPANILAVVLMMVRRDSLAQCHHLSPGYAGRSGPPDRHLLPGIDLPAAERYLRILQISFVLNNGLEFKRGTDVSNETRLENDFSYQPIFPRKRRLKLNEYCGRIGFHDGNDKFPNQKQKAFDMKISALLSTKKRERILNDVLFKQGEISVADVARRLRVSKGFVSKFFSLLSKERILKKSKNKYAVLANINVRLLRILFDLRLFTDFNFRKFLYVKGAGIYGSCAKGENSEDSDIDIWIKIDKTDERELAKLTGSLKKLSGRISPLYLSEEKLGVLRGEDPIFYNSIAHGSIKLYGEDIV